MASDNVPPVTGQAPNFGSSDNKVAAALNSLYIPCVRTVARQYEYDFARSNAALTLSGNAAPFPWSFEYVYPAGTVEVWQMLPAANSDLNNPLPIDWNAGNTTINNVQGRVIWTNQQNAVAVLNNMPNENTWDDLFRETVVRLLASELSNTVFGKPDQAEAFLNSGAAFEQINETRMG
jgi:hypothetical protein